MAATTTPLHLCHVQKPSLILNRSHITLHLIAIAFLIYYRANSLLQLITTKTTYSIILPYVLVFASELVLAFIWLLDQAFRWRPVSRDVYPEHLPGDDELPGFDVFICTADPSKEPTVDVMNTVVSAMALDYPPGKVHVYLSDDGGSTVTLQAMREAWRFARWWLPFCRKYGVKTRCPEAYFCLGGDNDDRIEFNSEFVGEKENVERKYEIFKGCVTRIREIESVKADRDHAPAVEVISSNEKGIDQKEMPLLVYVSREKRPDQPHHFKAGALNALLRVSGLISNSPYILVLDCDMYCNDPASARQAMCFHMDPKLAPSLSHVQFPQKFCNISDNDIYDSQLRSTFTVLWPGFDGLQGPCISGTCFYIKREALYDTSVPKDVDPMRLRDSLGPSNEFIKSLRGNEAGLSNNGDFSNALLRDTQHLASCAYENHTEWGKEVGFRYFSVVEDYFTGFNLHCKGWTSVYFNPLRPAFLGSGTTNLNDSLVQGTRWSAGLVEVALSKFSPLIYGSLRMSILESMCYAYLALFPLYSFPLWCLAVIPQLCLLNGISLYPQVSSSFFIIYAYIFLSSQFKHIQEVLSTGASMQSWLNEQRMWLTRAVTCHLYGSLNAIMETIGMREASFLPTNKFVDDEEVKLYRMGMYNFQTSTMLLVPLCTLVILNVASLVGGVGKLIFAGRCNEMFVQLSLCFYVVALSYPIIEGMVLRKDKGRVPTSVTLFSSLVSITIISLGSFLMY